ncbi:MAG: hypothetical protein Q8L09_03970 [Candidatus Moranbacteria bacterium]|nr:hypothetical protein [Candidatus Moranbacteria bacterium]
MLRPLDLAALLAVRVRASHAWTFASLAADVGVSASQLHTSLERAAAAGLYSRDDRHVNVTGLVEFLQHGVRWVFYAEVGERRRGVPTAHASPVLREVIAGGAENMMVWPSKEGTELGQSLIPLYPQAVQTVESCLPLYELLTLVDALRVGRRRDQEAAMHALRGRLVG